MKKGLYITILLITNFGFAQGYQAVIKRRGVSCGGFISNINYTYTIYNNATIVDQFLWSEPGVQQGPSRVILESSLPITSIRFVYSSACSGSPSTCGANQTFNVTDLNCFKGSVNMCARFDFEIYNTQNVLIQPTNNTICVDDLLQLAAENSCVVDTYSWEYATSITGPFQSLGVQSTGDGPVNVGLGAFLSSNYVGNVFIRATANGNYTNTIIYTVSACSPDILSLTPISTLCKGSSDGSFTIVFDESVNGGQVLFNLNQGSPTGPLTDFTATITGDTITWPNDLVADTYYLDYQLLPAGGKIFYSPIVIDEPDSITFMAEGSDVSCFQEGDGSIRIFHVMGGVGNYEFSLDDGLTWGRFENATATSHTAMNLGPGNYNVKIRDGNGCIAQEQQ